MDKKRLIRFLEDGVATLMDMLSRSPTPSQTILGARLAGALRQLADAGDKGDGSAFWRLTCQELGTLAANNDALFFMRWTPIRATMVHGMSDTTLANWRMLRQTPNWKDFWAPALRHPQYGHPPPFLPMMSTNAMAIEHATHLYRFHEQTGTKFHETDCILEFGGGYGSMCRLIHALGFHGTYIIFDLPHVLELQRYYLGLHGIEAEDGPGSGIRLCTRLDDVAAAINQILPSRLSAISTWAMSEMPIPLRHNIELLLTRETCTKLLLAWQPDFENNDNHAYFDDFRTRTQNRITWKQKAVGSNPDSVLPGDSQYLFGIRL